MASEGRPAEVMSIIVALLALYFLPTITPGFHALLLIFASVAVIAR
jgi:hypothetical protein